MWTVGTFIIYKSEKLSFMVNHSSFKPTVYGIVQLSRYLQQKEYFQFLCKCYYVRKLVSESEAELETQ